MTKEFFQSFKRESFEYVGFPRVDCECKAGWHKTELELVEHPGGNGIFVCWYYCTSRRVFYYDVRGVVNLQMVERKP